MSMPVTKSDKLKDSDEIKNDKPKSSKPSDNSPFFIEIYDSIKNLSLHEILKLIIFFKKNVNFYQENYSSQVFIIGLINGFEAASKSYNKIENDKHLEKVEKNLENNIDSKLKEKEFQSKTPSPSKEKPDQKEKTAKKNKTKNEILDEMGYSKLEAIYDRIYDKYKKTISKYQDSIKEKKIDIDTALTPPMDILDKQTSGKLSILEIIKNINKYVESTNFFKNTEIAKNNKLIPNLQAFTKKHAAETEQLGALIGITIYQRTHELFTNDFGSTLNSKFGKILLNPKTGRTLKGLLQLYSIYNELGNLKNKWEDLKNFDVLWPKTFSYNIQYPIISGVVSAIQKELAVSFPEIFPQIISETTPPPVKDAGIFSFANVKYVINSFVGDFKKASSDSASAYKKYSNLFFTSDPKEKEKLLKLMAENGSIGRCRKSILEILNNRTYLSYTFGVASKALQYTDTIKNFFSNIISGNTETVSLGTIEMGKYLYSKMFSTKVEDKKITKKSSENIIKLSV